MEKTGPSLSTSGPVNDPRVYLAAERTFLAWIRTAISLMGFGFVIARFALWVRGIGVPAGPSGPVKPNVSVLLGFGIVCVGVMIAVLAAVRHHGYIRALERGVLNPPLHTKTSLIVAGILAAAGLALAVNILLI